MAFQQFYYTSCEHGLSEYGGFQFNAVTPGVSPAVMREVEELTVYQPPRWPDRPSVNEPDAYPVAFSYAVNEATGAAITANVVFTGTDYSGRPGNYFAHALASGAPDHDFGSLLPAELWGSPLWHNEPAVGAELPEVVPPLPPGVIDRPGTQAFLEARGSDEILPELLTATGRAMAGDRPVLLVAQDVTETAWWIAAISYLLGERLARRMTFTTYSHRPGYARYHLTGTLPGILLPEAGASFQVFDLASGRAPRDTVHSLAATLASTGVMGAAGLWQQAIAFALGTETSLDDWDAPVAVAAGLLGRPLTAGQADTIARWLTGAAGRMPSKLADVTLGLLLGQPEVTLNDERLRDLLDLARQLPAPPRAEHLEELLTIRAIGRISGGEPAVPVVFTTPAAVTAGDLALQFLGQAALGQAVAVLDWAAASGVGLPEDSLRRYGRALLSPDASSAELAAVARRHPEICRGLLERLADEPPEIAREVLSGPVGTQLKRADLAGHPELTELWLLQSAVGGRVPPIRAFDEIVDIRDAAGRSPRVDATLLNLLWPRDCPPDDLAGLLGIFTDPPAPGVTDWFAVQLSSITARATASGPWMRLAQVLSGNPILDLLPEQESRQAQSVARVLWLLRQARDGGPQGDTDAFARLYREYPASDEGIRTLLERELPAALARARPLGPALGDCPDALASAFFLALRDWLNPSAADTALARRVFAASRDLALAAQPALGEHLMAVFEQVRQWNRRDLSALAQSMSDDPALAQSFQRWRKIARGGRPRRRLGGTDPSAQGT